MACCHVFSDGSAWTSPPAGESSAAFNARRARLPDTPFVGPSSSSLCPAALASPSAPTTSDPYLSHRAGTYTLVHILLFTPIALAAVPFCSPSRQRSSPRHGRRYSRHPPQRIKPSLGVPGDTPLRRHFTSKLAIIVYDRVGIHNLGQHQRLPSRHQRRRGACQPPGRSLGNGSSFNIFVVEDGQLIGIVRNIDFRNTQHTVAGTIQSGFFRPQQTTAFYNKFEIVIYLKMSCFRPRVLT